MQTLDCTVHIACTADIGNSTMNNYSWYSFEIDRLDRSYMIDEVHFEVVTVLFLFDYGSSCLMATKVVVNIHFPQQSFGNSTNVSIFKVVNQPLFRLPNIANLQIRQVVEDNSAR